MSKLVAFYIDQHSRSLAEKWIVRVINQARISRRAAFVSRLMSIFVLQITNPCTFTNLEALQLARPHE